MSCPWQGHSWKESLTTEACSKAARPVIPSVQVGSLLHFSSWRPEGPDSTTRQDHLYLTGSFIPLSLSSGNPWGSPRWNMPHAPRSGISPGESLIADGRKPLEKTVPPRILPTESTIPRSRLPVKLSRMSPLSARSAGVGARIGG
jgi:hypothetical protein